MLPWGIITGVTTNRKIFLAEKGCNFRERVEEILSLVDGPVSIELTKTDRSDKELIEEAIECSNWNSNKIVIKVPMFGDGRGLRIVSQLRKANVNTNMTALITTSQVILAARAGTTYASVFFNRILDSDEDAERVIRESRAVLDRMNTSTRIIVGSIRKPEDVARAAIAGAHIVTIPYKILAKMPFHPKTEETIKEFEFAWREFMRVKHCVPDFSADCPSN
jgi:transaldolase